MSGVRWMCSKKSSKIKQMQVWTSGYRHNVKLRTPLCADETPSSATTTFYWDVFWDVLRGPRNRGRALGAVAGFATSRPSAFHSHPNLNKRSQVTINCLVTWEAFKTRQFRQCSLDQLGNQSQQDSPRMMFNNFEGSPHLLLRSPSCCPPFWRPPRHHARGGTSR